MKLSVIIVNYNVKRYLMQCLRSVEKAIEGLEADVWVVDNCSADGSLDFLKPLFPRVHFIANEENVGFSKANNRAIRLSSSDYVLLLNPDTIVARETIQAGVQWLDEHPEAGAVAASMHGSTGLFANESRRGIPTPLVSFCKITGLNKFFPNHRVIGRYYMQYLDRHKPSRIEILSGAYMMIRRKALDQVGLLDEDFFMYGEDVDLSYRLLQGGWKNYYVPYPIIHYKGESDHPSTIRYVNIFHKAMIIFYEKHFSRRYLLSGLLIRVAVYLKAGATLMAYLLRGVKNVFSGRAFGLKPNKRLEGFDFYCLCRDENREAIARHVEDMQSKVTFVRQAAEANGSKTKLPALLLDTTMFTYDEILHIIIRQQEEGRACLLCTYTPEIGILVP